MLFSRGDPTATTAGKTAADEKAFRLLLAANEPITAAPSASTLSGRRGTNSTAAKPNRFQKGKTFVRLDGIRPPTPSRIGVMVELRDVDPKNPDTRWQVSIPGGNAPPISIATTKTIEIEERDGGLVDISSNNNTCCWCGE